MSVTLSVTQQLNNFMVEADSIAPSKGIPD